MARKRIKFRRPSLSRMSTVPAVWMTAETVKTVNRFIHDFPGRIEPGMKLMLLHSAKEIVDVLKSIAPEVSGSDYTKHLKIGEVTGMRNEEAVAIYINSTPRELYGPDYEKNNVLIYDPKKGSPKWVGVLEKYHPWPADLAPVKTTSNQAKVYVREVTLSEVSRLRNRLIINHRKIESEFAYAGLPNVDLKPSKSADGTVVFDDLAFSIMRVEFGIGTPMVAHWRPALKRLKSRLMMIRKAFIQYIVTGKPAVFDLPENDPIPKAKLGESNRYQEQLVKSVK